MNRQENIILKKTRMIDFFVGQVMKKTRGKENPAKTMENAKRRAY